ncbi:MAG TPA: hypothetical protein VK909_10505, partial [Anaerolineales bacterium]|nr:hypothetical protein [Anaerolineales bacterium]
LWSMIPSFEAGLSEEKFLQLSTGQLIHLIANPDSEGPKLLVFNDSFYYGLEHFLKPHFREIVTVQLSSSKEIWSLDWINHTSPNIVIIELVERNLEDGLLTLLASASSR